MYAKLLQKEGPVAVNGTDDLPRNEVQLLVWLTKYAANHPISRAGQSGQLLINLEDPRVQEAFEVANQSIGSFKEDQAKIISSQGRILRKMMEVDGLDEVTGLPPWHQGRFVLSETVVTENRRNGFAVVFTDLFGFKPVNDKLGHQMGNRVLRRVAEILRGYIREYDYITRYGGDENLIILKELESIDEAVTKVVELFWRVPDHDWPSVVEGIPAGYRLGHDIGLIYCVNPSAAVRAYIEHFDLSSAVADQIVEKADSNMYKSKAAHKEGRLEIWSSVARFGYGSVRFYGNRATKVVR